MWLSQWDYHSQIIFPFVENAIFLKHNRKYFKKRGSVLKLFFPLLRPCCWTSNHFIRNVWQTLWCVYFQCKFKINPNCAIMNWCMNLQCYGPIIVRMDSYGICGACSYITIQLYGIDLIWHEIIMICGVMHVCLGYYELRYRKRWWVNILLSLPPCIADLYILFVGLP